MVRGECDAVEEVAEAIEDAASHVSDPAFTSGLLDSIRKQATLARFNGLTLLAYLNYTPRTPDASTSVLPRSLLRRLRGGGLRVGPT